MRSYRYELDRETEPIAGVSPAIANAVKLLLQAIKPRKPGWLVPLVSYPIAEKEK